MKTVVWYIHAGEYDVLTESVTVMQSYDWVDTIYILHTNTFVPIDKIGDLERKYSKVIEICHNYGSGFEKSYSDGGFNEVAARNHLINICVNNTDSETWLLQCDADEFYTYDFGKEILLANNENYDSISVNCNHFLNMETVGNPEDPDPHLRVFKAGIGLRFIENPNKEFLERFANKSVHCVLAGELKYKSVTGLYHIHTHDIWPNKSRPCEKTKKIDFSWPINYINVFKEF